MNFRKRVWLLILFSTFLRCSIASLLEFGNDEVYYWTYALHLHWNYFDHPPMVALLIRLGSANLYFHEAFFIRLGSIICAGINTWMVFLIGCRIKDARAGWYASILYTSSFYCSIIAGTFILPDSPQLIFWVLSIFLMTKSIDRQNEGKSQAVVLLLLGATIGLCIMSKVHGIFLWFGFGGYILFFQRLFLKNPFLYFAMLLTVLIISPIFIWNWQHQFVNYSFHNDRVGFFGKKIDLDTFLQQIFGSVFYNNPINFVLYCLAVIGLSRHKAILPLQWIRLFLWLGLPLIMVLLAMSLFNETLPHWSGPAYISILLLTASYFSGKNQHQARMPRGLLAALLFFVFIVLAAVPVIRWIPGTIGKKQAASLGDGDVTLDMTGWKQFSVTFDSLYVADAAATRMKPQAFIISGNWFPAAHLDFYVAQSLGCGLIATGRLTDIHQYAWLNMERPPMTRGADAYFIYPTNYHRPPTQVLRDRFERIDSLVVPQTRGGIPSRNFVIYRLHGYRGGIPRNGVTEN